MVFLLLATQVMASQYDDLFLGASPTYTWGSTIPADLAPHCEKQSTRATMCLASDERINPNTRARTNLTYCADQLVRVVGTMYGPGARDTAMAMSGALTAALGPGITKNGRPGWARGVVVLTVGRGSAIDEWNMITVDTDRFNRLCS